MNREGKNWLFALALTTPMIIFFASYLFNCPSYLLPTGFIQYDNPVYVAFARQHLDSGSFSFLCSNPFNDSANYSPIYFQPQSLLLAFALKLGAHPGSVLIPFTIICTLICFRILIAIIDHLSPGDKHRSLLIILFAWGGGLLVFAGAASYFFNVQHQSFFDSLLSVDPGGGWWGLNLGRSLFIAVEAYYHVLFLAVILCILKKKWTAAILFAFLLLLSHPFTAIELLSILCGWLFVEKIIIKNKDIPWLFAVCTGSLFILCILYYLYYLLQFADHKSVSEQFSLNWYIRIARMLPAYAITGCLSVIAARRAKKSFFGSFHSRLFFCWFIIAFLLAKHELFMKPVQPIHFTRGYIWTSLFLLGLPGLQWLLNHIRALKYGKLILALFIIVFLLDNFWWVAKHSVPKHEYKSAAYITKEEKNILDILSRTCTDQTLIIGYRDERNEVLPYLAVAYTSAYSWIPHPFTTPFAARKKAAYDLFIKNGTLDPAWKEREVVFIFRKKDAAELKRSFSLPFTVTPLIETPSYKVLTARIP